MPRPRPSGQLASWRRAAGVAGVTLAVTGAAALVLAWLVATESMTLGQVLTTAGALLAGAFGTGVDGQMGGSFLVIGGTARGSAHAVPLTLTMLAGVTAVTAFRRATRRSAGGWADVVDAARSACVLAGLVLVVALLARSGSGFVLVALDWIAARDADQVRGDWGAVAWQAPLGAFAGTFVLLLVTALLRGGAGRSWAAPVRGVVTLAALLPVAGLLGLLMLAGGEPAATGDLDVEPSSGIGLALAYLANWGFAVLALGVLAPAGRTVAGSASGELDVALGDFHERLGHWTQQEPGLWAAIGVALLVLALSARSVVRACDDVRRVPGDLLRWLLLLVPVLPALGLLARLSGTGSVVGQVWGDRGRGELSATLGVDLLPATGSLLAAAAVVALVMGGTALSRTRDGRTLRSSGTTTSVDRTPSDGHAPAPRP